MKKINLLILATVLILSCNKLKELVSTNFNFNNDTAEFVIPASSSTSYSKSETFRMNLDSLIKANNAELAISFMKTLTINSIDVTLVDPDSLNNLANISSCTVSFSSNVNPTQVQIGALSSNPDAYKSTMNIPVNTSIDVKEYAKTATSFNYTLAGTLRRPLVRDIKCRVKVNYKLTAGL
jgi:hypothetical protein